MTLIARILVDEAPVFFADALLTTEAHIGHPIDIVASDDINRTLQKYTDCNIAGLTQKLNLITDRLLVAWAGELDVARQLFSDFNALDEHGQLNSENIIKILKESFFAIREKIALIGVLLTKDAEGHTTGAEWFDLNGEISQSKLGDNQCEITVAGSGSESFLGLLEGVFPFIDTNGHPLEQAHELSLALIATVFPNEILTGGNLLDRWGGAYEIATIQNGEISKVSDMLFTFWRVFRQEDESLALSLIPRFIFQNYFHDVLVIQEMESKVLNGRIQPPIKKIRLILPVLKNQNDYDLSEFRPDEIRPTTLCVFTLPQDDVSKEVAGVRVYHNSDGEDRFTFKANENHLNIKISPQLIADITTDISSTLGKEVIFDRIGN